MSRAECCFKSFPDSFVGNEVTEVGGWLVLVHAACMLI